MKGKERFSLKTYSFHSHFKRRKQNQNLEKEEKIQHMGILDPTEAGFSVDEDFLNFTIDVACVGDDEDSSTLLKTAAAFDHSGPRRNISYPTQNGLSPKVVEEELEWLLDKDAFPTVESCFGILSDNPELAENHLSPVSVLENSSGSSSNNSGNINGNGSTVASCCGSFKIPINHPVGSRSKKRTRRSAYGEFTCQNFFKSVLVNVKIKPEPSQMLPSTKVGSSMGRRCLHCQADKTPQWRAGPMGPKTLCNACGVRYKSGRLFPEYRPATSPTFSSILHSNSHRKVVEMRRQNQQLSFGDAILVNETCVDTG